MYPHHPTSLRFLEILPLNQVYGWNVGMGNGGNARCCQGRIRLSPPERRSLCRLSFPLRLSSSMTPLRTCRLNNRLLESLLSMNRLSGNSEFCFRRVILKPPIGVTQCGDTGYVSKLFALG